jgi:signal transduction histidine kinase
VLDALRAILGVLNQDDDGDYFICKEAEQTIAHCRAIAEGAKGADFYHLDDREHATVLAALRYWQREGGIMALREWDIASNDETLVPLDDKDIDALCERLNCGG